MAIHKGLIFFAVFRGEDICGSDSAVRHVGDFIQCSGSDTGLEIFDLFGTEV